VEVGNSLHRVVVGPNCLARGLAAVVLPRYGFTSVHPRFLLRLLGVGSGTVLLCRPHRVDLPLASTSIPLPTVSPVYKEESIAAQGPFPLEVVEHNAAEVNPFRKGCGVPMLDLWILVGVASVGPDK